MDISNPSIPLIWMNLNRHVNRRAKMNWALQKGNWNSQRFQAIDSENLREVFIPIPNLLNEGSPFPGVLRKDEIEPSRKTTRSELACFASWQEILIQAEKIRSSWILLMEDDLGASLGVPNEWPIQISELAAKAPKETLAIQLAPISAKIRIELHKEWEESKRKRWLVPKKNIRSHGNGAVLLHYKGLKRLIPLITRVTRLLKRNYHPLLHPWRSRPVADKWLYAQLPMNSCQVITYPLFCLEAKDSSLHPNHVNAYHLPSRKITLDIWSKDGYIELINAQKEWDDLK